MVDSNNLDYSLGKEFAHSSVGEPDPPRAAILEQAVAGVRAMDVPPDQNRFLSYADYN